VITKRIAGQGYGDSKIVAILGAKSNFYITSHNTSKDFLLIRVKRINIYKDSPAKAIVTIKLKKGKVSDNSSISTLQTSTSTDQQDDLNRNGPKNDLNHNGGFRTSIPYDLCGILIPIKKSECPDKFDHKNCKDVAYGELCEADDNQCGTSHSENNCIGYDMYKKKECKDHNTNRCAKLSDENKDKKCKKRRYRYSCSICCSN